MASPVDIEGEGNGTGIHREVIEATNRRDWDTLRSLHHPQYSYTGGDGQEQTGGPDVGLRIAQMYANAFPDLRLELKRVYVQGDTAIAEMSYSGTHKGELMGIAPTGKCAEGNICNIIEVRDGKIYRERDYFDMNHLLTQLGVLQAPAGTPGLGMPFADVEV